MFLPLSLSSFKTVAFDLLSNAADMIAQSLTLKATWAIIIRTATAAASSPSPSTLKLRRTRVAGLIELNLRPNWLVTAEHTENDGAP